MKKLVLLLLQTLHEEEAVFRIILQPFCVKEVVSWAIWEPMKISSILQ